LEKEMAFSVMEKIPSMADDALANLLANAERLETEGSKSQRASATDLLPVIKAELETRRAAKLDRAAQARRAKAEIAGAARAAAAAG
jgi:hypothetical protein